MSLTYGLRLFCLLTVVVGLIDASLQLALLFAARFLMRRLSRVGSRTRERIVYLVQIAPALLGFLFAGAVCLPEYLRFEPAHQHEPVGWLTLLLAAAVLLWFGAALFGGFRITHGSLNYARLCRRSGRAVRHSGGIPILALPSAAPPLGIVGFARPFVVISQDLLESGVLDASALQLALDHERSHIRHFDNCKLFSLCFLPRLPGDRWLRRWQLAADCAADDDASRCDPARSLSLAEALIRTARSVKPSRRPIVCTALTSAEAELATRIDRLLRPRRPSHSAGNSLLLGLASAVLLVVGAAAIATPWIYTASEHILHLGGF